MQREPMIRQAERHYATADGRYVLRIETAFSLCRRPHIQPDGDTCPGAVEHPYDHWQLYHRGGAKADRALLATFILTEGP